MDYLRGTLGIAILVAIAFLFSRNKKSINWRLVVSGIALQFLAGFLILKVSFVAQIFSTVSEGFVKFLSFSEAGAEFLFGELVDASSFGFIFAFQVLPTIIFFSTVSAGLYYLGILQKIVYGIAWIMARTMHLSGAESLSAAGNIFLGQTEAPLLVKPYISRMTYSELMCLMTGGMATIAGGVLAGYVAFLGGDDPAERTRFAAYLLSASIMNAPAAIVIAKILIPETKEEKINYKLNLSDETLGVNLIDALSKGASDGLRLAVNVGAMLLAFIAVIAALNFLLKDVLGDITNLNGLIVNSTGGEFEGLSLEYLLGQIFRIFAFIMGVEWQETLEVGSLLGQKTVINEFVAYLSMSEMKADQIIQGKALVVATYALCGFSNFSSIAIQIGGIGSIAPNQQANLSKLGLWALLAATIACMMTGTLAGMLVNH
ncbi:CNT family concentrative nucleoside transporter [Catalinimonas alkaloidigena]|uniref:NupC/NupG family nucleoside CNT transporter n=1 Tax=Catalinimonas alkaloidigena TaxID=1075417 RepID=UPI002404FC80|nr:nucleoside transporter C-terminal domain-containing protein [Catalinimonas alkaloidigena]MDF9797747.1 CNT family concentrative nucleoside transporter [Catalinimonas alkaloidigena]